MKHPQTAVPAAADYPGVLYFQQALWSHRIMQSLPHDKDAQPWGSNTDLLFPRQNKCHTSLTLQMPHGEYEPGSKQLVHSWEALLASHVSLCRRQLYRLPTTQNKSPTISLSVARCTLMQANMRLHKGTQNMKPFCCQCEKLACLSVSSLSLCFEIFASAPVLWAPLLLFKAPETKTGGWEPEAGGRMM